MAESTRLGSEEPPSPRKSKDEKEENEESGGFWGIVQELISSIPYKISILLFIVLVLMNSTSFMEFVLEPMGKAYYDGGQLTNLGTYIHCLFMVLGYIGIDMLVRAGVV